MAGVHRNGDAVLHAGFGDDGVLACRSAAAGRRRRRTRLDPLAFFLCWTRKEAFSKAVGEGLSLSLDRYRVTCTPDDPARIVEIDGNETEAAAWSVFDLRPDAGCVGAAVTRGSPGRTLLDLDVEPELRVVRRG